MTTTASGSKKNPTETQGLVFARRNSQTINTAKRSAALKNGSDDSIRLALSTSEAATALGVSVRTLHRLRERDLIKPSRALRTMVWPVSELVKFLETTR